MVQLTTQSRFLISIMLGFLLCMRFVKADVSMVKPQTGATYKVSGSSVDIDVMWEDDGNSPTLDEVSTYSFTLCSGPNSNIEAIKTLATRIKASDISDYTYTLTIPETLSENGIYYVQVLAKGTFGYTIHYSGRFTLSGMSGTIVASSAGAISTPPAPQYMITQGTNAKPTINTAWFTIPYTEQTGISRFAPMQSQPKSSVDLSKYTTWTRRFPTSAVTYYSTFRKTMDCSTTITPGWSYTLTSDINYQTADAGPVSNGGWYDPKERMSLSTRKVNGKVATAS